MTAYIKGILDCLKGFSLITQPGIRNYVIVPLLINISLFSVAIYFFIYKIQGWIEDMLPGWLSWLEWLIWPIIALTLLLVVFYTFTIVANIIAAPFNSLLSLRVEKHLGASDANDNTDALWKLTIRTISSEFHKLLYFSMWLIPLLILLLIPGINFFAAFFWFIYAAWSFALEYTDYPLANRNLFFKDIRQYNRDNRMRCLGLGTGVFIITSIPVLNFIAMPVAVCAATHLTTTIPSGAKSNG